MTEWHKEYEEPKECILSPVDAEKLLRAYEVVKASGVGCPPDFLRVQGHTRCFYCTDCWIAALKKQLGIE